MSFNSHCKIELFVPYNGHQKCLDKSLAFLISVILNGFRRSYFWNNRCNNQDYWQNLKIDLFFAKTRKASATAAIVLIIEKINRTFTFYLYNR